MKMSYKDLGKILKNLKQKEELLKLENPNRKINELEKDIINFERYFNFAVLKVAEAVETKRNLSKLFLLCKKYNPALSNFVEDAILDRAMTKAYR